MNGITDAQLLERFVRDECEEASAALVTRHVHSKVLAGNLDTGPTARENAGQQANMTLRASLAGHPQACPS